MVNILLHLFLTALLISILSFGGGAPALFYQFGVTQTGWITGTDLAAVLAFGYATPGPSVFGAAAFTGYHLAGLLGAIVGSLRIFIVPWLLAILTAKHLNDLLNIPHASYVIKYIGLAAAGVVAATALSLMPPQIISHITLLLIAIGAFMAVAWWKMNPLYVLVVGGLLGVVVH